MRSSTRAWWKSSDSSATRMPANRNGGQRLSTRRIVRAETLRMRSGQQQGRQLAAVAADQVLILEDAEGIDQGFPGQAVFEVAVAPQHLDELLQPGFGVAADDLLYAEQVARAQVVRVGVDRRLQHLRLRRVGEQAGEIEPCARLHRALVRGQVGGQGVDELRGFARAAGGQQGKRQVELEFGLVGFGLDRLAQAHHFGVRIDRRRGKLFRVYVRGLPFDRGRARFDAVVLEELAQLRFGRRAGETVDQLAVLYQHHRRDGTDLERGGELLFGLDIDLGQLERTVVFAGQFLQHRAELLAWPAPLGPEIDQHRHLQRALDDLRLEAVGGGVEHVRLGGGGGHGQFRVGVVARWRRRVGNPTGATGLRHICKKYLTSAIWNVKYRLHQVSYR